MAASLSRVEGSQRSLHTYQEKNKNSSKSTVYTGYGIVFLPRDYFLFIIIIISSFCGNKREFTDA